MCESLWHFISLDKTNMISSLLYDALKVNFRSVFLKIPVDLCSLCRPNIHEWPLHFQSTHMNPVRSLLKSTWFCDNHWFFYFSANLKTGSTVKARSHRSAFLSVWCIHSPEKLCHCLKPLWGYLWSPNTCPFPSLKHSPRCLALSVPRKEEFLCLMRNASIDLDFHKCYEGECVQVLEKKK